MWAVWANHGALRWDKNEEKYIRRPKPEDKDKESQRVKDTTQTYIVASVLIATMAFSAILAIPGGYRADDHTNGGTPTLAGGLVFDAFIMATTLAFICSLLATTGFMVAGNPMLNLNTRSNYLTRCDFLFGSSVTCMSTVFALGVYMMVAPVARHTAVATCVITPAILVGKDIWRVTQLVVLARPLLIRLGIFPGMVELLGQTLFIIARLFWPLIVILGWITMASIQRRPEQSTHLSPGLFWYFVVTFCCIVLSIMIERLRRSSMQRPG
jgi:hypothetical protein